MIEGSHIGTWVPVNAKRKLSKLIINIACDKMLIYSPLKCFPINNFIMIETWSTCSYGVDRKCTKPFSTLRLSMVYCWLSNKVTYLV